MKTSPSLLAAAATFLLHAALVAAVATGLSVSRQQVTNTEPVKVLLLMPTSPLPATQPAVQQPQEKKRTEPKPRPQRKPVIPPRETAAPQAQPPETSFEAKPSPPATTVVPAAPVAAIPGPATPAPPTKTSVSDAAYASSNRKPPYPRLSRINDEEGTVVLRVLVKADGTAGAVEVKNSSGYPQLDESARSTVQTWRFKPATVDGKPVSEWYQLAIPFTLQNN